jgi:SP family general alpha glucoside:H+ symporter-like MFS transporter
MSNHSDEKKGHVAEDVTVLEVEDARAAIAKEHSLGLRDALKAYPKAIIWSLLLSSAVIMEGYDTILVSGRPRTASGALESERAKKAQD